ncbi:MAG: argininosuccinate lyase [Actinomycetota bacterium]|nr:argininosuccinate lyase [Actinomycetota bacterium]
MTLWQGRLGSRTAAGLWDLSESLSFDYVLAREDLAASGVHVRGLNRVGLLTDGETESLLDALAQVAAELGVAPDGSDADRAGDGAADGRTRIVPEAGDEDIHTLIERRVTEIAGEAGAKLHTGRSRNDQVATAVRLFCKRQVVQVLGAVLDLQQALLDKARDAGDAYLPGYTHMQRAQPVLLAHHLLAHGWALARDVDRLCSTRTRADVSPLGAGALAGSSLPLDPDWLASELGFASRFENSLDAVSDRDFVAEVLFDLSMVGVHLSRIGEELVLWSTDEFGFVRMADDWATGSSMLPQKKNPDAAELARGKAGRLIGHLTGLLTTLKGLPLSYNRDLQEDKEPLFDSVLQVKRVLVAVAGMVSSVEFDVVRMQQAADGPAAAAVDLAEWLVERGTPFRRAHAVVGALVREAAERRVPLAELVQGQPELGEEAVSLLEPGVAAARRRTPGGAGSAAVLEQTERFAARIRIDRDRLERATPGPEVPRSRGQQTAGPSGVYEAAPGGLPVRDGSDPSTGSGDLPGG